MVDKLETPVAVSFLPSSPSSLAHLGPIWQMSIKACVVILPSIEKVMYLEPFDSF